MIKPCNLVNLEKYCMILVRVKECSMIKMNTTKS